MKKNPGHEATSLKVQDRRSATRRVGKDETQKKRKPNPETFYKTTTPTRIVLEDLHRDVNQAVVITLNKYRAIYFWTETIDEFAGVISRRIESILNEYSSAKAPHGNNIRFQILTTMHLDDSVVPLQERDKVIEEVFNAVVDTIRKHIPDIEI